MRRRGLTSVILFMLVQIAYSHNSTEGYLHDRASRAAVYTCEIDSSTNAIGQQSSSILELKGTIIERHSGKAIELATVFFKDLNKWDVTNAQGQYSVKHLRPGKYNIAVTCLGYKTIEQEIWVNNDSFVHHFEMEVLSLGLNEVTVTAIQTDDDLTTSYTIENEAIEHAQMSNIAELTSLLPGGQTRSNNLIQASGRIAIRSEQGEEDRPSFGTALEIDGIRMSSNGAIVSEIGTEKGVDTRVISPDNIAKVDIMAGIPSVEHGDLTSGLVKITTKQGVEPLSIKLRTNPYQKEVALSKGLKIGNNGGLLNVSYNYTNSVSNIVSPYNSYERNAFTFRHKKVFGANKHKPLIINSTIAGNIGGRNDKEDPDNFKDTYKKYKAFNLRGGIDFNWNPNLHLISELNLMANINYNDNQSEEYDKESSSSGGVAFHGTEEGYFVGEPYVEGQEFSPLQLIDRGHWYQTTYVDSKPVNYDVRLKIQKNHKGKSISSQFKIGGNYSASGNEGKGVYYGNKLYTPTWREYQYKNEPYLHNVALFVEESFKYTSNNKQQIHLTAGLRNDYTLIKNSLYDNVNALSPRFNARYSFINKPRNRGFKKLSIHGGWGQSVKLPSLNMLYIRPSYSQKLAFVPGSLADGSTYYAYYIQPGEVAKNDDLKWQKSRKYEIGIQGQYRNIRFSLCYFNTVTKNSYTESNQFIPFTYYLTTPHQLADVAIPVEHRSYSIDQQGAVTVIDNTGTLPNEELDKKEKRSFKSVSYGDNASPVKRYGLEWVLDFGKIKPLYTSVRLDGTYYYYKHLNHKIEAVSLGDNHLMSDGSHYQYIGYYYGGSGVANGYKTKRLRANANFITHIQRLKLVVTLKVEACLINSKQLLSEMPGGERSFELDIKEGYIPKPDRGSIYEGKNFVGTYPLYYTTFDDMETKIPFRETFYWAYENDRTLYNDLSKLVETRNFDYLFLEDALSVYLSANINISKEIGKRFRLSFYARNFLNNMAKIKDKQTNTEVSLLNSSYIPELSYGIGLNIKI